MSRALSIDADLTVRSPAGTGRVVGSGSKVEVALPWRLLLSLLLSRPLRRETLRGWRLLERSGIKVTLRLPGLPAVDLDRLSFILSLGITSAVALAIPLALLR